MGFNRVMGSTPGVDEGQPVTADTQDKPRGPLVSRRNFLKGTAAAVIASLAAGGLGALAKDTPAPTDAESPQAREARLKTPKDIVLADLTQDKMAKLDKEQVYRVHGFATYSQRTFDLKQDPQVTTGKNVYPTGQHRESYTDLYQLSENPGGEGSSVSVTLSEDIASYDQSKISPTPKQFEGKVEVIGKVNDSGMLNRIYKKPTAYHLEARSIQPLNPSGAK